MCQQPDAVLRFSSASWQEVLQAFVEPWVVWLEGSERWQYLLSSARVPSYNMLGILSDNSRSQHPAQHAHQITEAATLIKQLRKWACSDAWGKWKEPWGFAGSLGCLQRRSYAPTSCTLSMFQSINMLLPALLKTFSVKNQARTGKKSRPLLHLCCLSTWIVKMTSTLLWERFNILIFPDSGLCNDLELLEKGTPFQMQWYSVPFQHQNI